MEERMGICFTIRCMFLFLVMEVAAKANKNSEHNVNPSNSFRKKKIKNPENNCDKRFTKSLTQSIFFENWVL